MAPLVVQRNVSIYHHHIVYIPVQPTFFFVVRSNRQSIYQHIIQTLFSGLKNTLIDICSMVNKKCPFEMLSSALVWAWHLTTAKVLGSWVAFNSSAIWGAYLIGEPEDALNPLFPMSCKIMSYTISKCLICKNNCHLGKLTRFCQCQKFS